MAGEQVRKEQGASHEPERGCVVLDQPQRLARTTRVGTFRIVARSTRCAWPPRHRRAPPNWFMVAMRDSEIVEVFHESRELRRVLDCANALWSRLQAVRRSTG